MTDVAGYWARRLMRNLQYTEPSDWLPPLKQGEWVFERQMTRADLGLPDFPPMPPMPDVAYAFWLGKDGQL